MVEEDPVNDKERGARICRTPGDAGCTFIFKYAFPSRESRGDIKFFEIQAQKERTCPTPINILGKQALCELIFSLMLKDR